MKKKRKVDTRELGLDAALVLGKYFFKTEDLHYGYWPEDLEVAIENFVTAQENHSSFIMSHFPDTVKSVLDVGCGTGTLMKKLVDKGYTVDGVCPSPFLCERVRERVGMNCELFPVKFEQVQTDKRYDLIMFSESFQYVRLLEAFSQAIKYLNPGGHILICDFFKTEAPGKSALSGGHRLSTFYKLLPDYPLELLEDKDITEQTAPNLQLIHEMLTDVGHPLWKLIFYFAENNYPLVFRFLSWKYKKKIEKINRRYFGGERDAENFKKFKSYRLFLFRLNEEVNQE